MGRTQRLAQPKDFGKYQLVARLANGRMADVYKAKSHGVEGFEKVLCIKIIHPGLAASPEFVETLIDEAKRSVALSHANIAQVLDLGREEAQQKYYVAMEFIGGLDLARGIKLARQFDHPWTQELSVFIASEVAKGLDYAHRRKDFNFNNLNILHRSLRPENIMLSYDGEVKITDFGLSRAMETAEPHDDNDVIDRILYAPPEAARGEGYTRQSDIFSLGLVLYEMLAGFHPYRHDDVNEIGRRARNAQISPISNHIEIPRQLQQILESMLVADPAGRAQSAGQLYEELIGYIFGNALQADNRMLSLIMQELRRREQDSTKSRRVKEVGLEEISQHELNTAFAEGGAFHDHTGNEAISPSALPTSRLTPNKQGPAGDPPLPGALEKIFKSVAAGKGKAVLLSGRMGRGRQVFIDRLVDAVDLRSNADSSLIHTSHDDKLRPFGVISDLILRSVHHTVVETLDHRQEALKMLGHWGVSEDALETMSTLWQLNEGQLLDQAARKLHLAEILRVVLREFSSRGAYVLIVDRVERLDQVSLDTIRDVIATIGELPVMLVMGTQSPDTIRSRFDAGKPKNLEAIVISGEDPPTPEDLQELPPVADSLLTLLTLADRPMAAGDAAALLEADARAVAQASEDLVERGAIRIPQPGNYRSDVPNWLTWRRNHKDDGDEARLAAILARHYVHRVARGEMDRLTPTLLRLYAIAGDRRHLVPLAGQFGDWLQRNAWQHTALTYYQHISELLGHHGVGVPQIRVGFVLEAAELALEMALIDHCRTLLEPLSVLTETTRNEVGFVHSQLLLGQLAMQQDDLEEARAHFQRSVQTARGLQNPELLARSTLALAGWYERFGDPAAALDRLESAVNLYTRFGTRRMDLKARATLLQRTSRMWADRGMIQRALRPLHDLQELARAVPYPSIRCRAAIAMGRLSAHRGDIDGAGENYDQGLTIARDNSLSALAIELLRERASLCVRFERYENAIAWADEVIGFAESRGDYYSEQRARDLRALACCHVQKDIQPALEQLRTSLRRATERGVPKDVFRGHDFMARALEAVGRSDEAGHHRQHADELGRTMRMTWAA